LLIIKLILLFFKDPGKQFDLVEEHIFNLRQVTGRLGARVFVYVERNLGFEAGQSQFLLGFDYD